MKQKIKKNSKLIYALLSIIFVAFIAVFIGNIMLEKAVTPKGGVPEASNGISFESLSGAKSAYLSGGFTSRRIAAAVTGAAAELPADAVEVLKLTVFGADSQCLVTVSKSVSTGDLFSACPDGTVRKVNKKLLKTLMNTPELTGLESAEQPSAISVNGTAVSPAEYRFKVETAFETLDWNWAGDGSAQTISSANAASPEISGVELFDTVTVSLEGQEVFAGTVAELASFAPTDNGLYMFSLTRVTDIGPVVYSFNVDYDFMPSFSISASEVQQGGVMTVTVGNANGRELSAGASFDYTATFMNGENSSWCYIPVSHTVEPGSYSVTVRCGEYEQTFPVSVTSGNFEVQNLTVSEETVSSTTTDEARAEFNAVMDRVYANFDPTTYWSGTFIQPVAGSITTEYGIYRYTNGSTTPTRHAGIDIAADEGTPIKAPAAGKVIYSGMLTLSGNTVVIEHGNGLHSIFYHMSELSCKEGDMLSQGDQVGLVGSTGYSTGPHLHYQLMIGNFSINPWRAFDGTAGFYAINQN